MRSWLWGWLLGTGLVLVACGGKVIVDGIPEGGSGGAGGAGGASTSSTSGNSSAGSIGTTSTAAGGALMACTGKPCNTPCTVCNNIECIQGRCDSFGICVPNQPKCP